LAGNYFWFRPRERLRIFKQFTWDPGKAASNRQKHGIDFADAATVFDDDYFVSQEGLTAQGERRFMGTGMEAYGRIVTVLYTVLSEDDIRLISARRATRRERSYSVQYRRH
jgi:hypothetical protein